MTTETPVETITETLGRLLMFLQERRVRCRADGRHDHALAGAATRATATSLPNRIRMLGDGQMLLPGIAEPRLWSFNRTV